MFRVSIQIAVIGALAGIATACGLTEKKFEKKLITAQCELYEECSPTEFGAEFEDVKACEDAVGVSSDIDLAYYEDCDFVKDEAKDCLKAIESLPCEAEEADYVDFNNSCHNVWICEGGIVPVNTEPGNTSTSDTDT